MSDVATAGNSQGLSVRGRSKSRVFISYSRDDLDFADQLDKALVACGFEPKLDRSGISGGEAWQAQLGSLIREADTIIFLLSPSSAKSEMCAWEVREAAALGKRIVPVVCRPLGEVAAPPQLSALNYIFFYAEPRAPGSGFGAGLDQLVTALNTDLDWLREHTRLLQRAIEWDQGGRPDNRLLSGADIDRARAWVAARPDSASEPTHLHLDFIRASEIDAASRTSAERRRFEEMAAAQAERAKALETAEAAIKARTHAQRRLIGSVTGGLLLAIALAGVAGYAAWQARLGRLDAEAQKHVAEDQKKEVERRGSELALANRRLSTEMKLRIAPFGTTAYTISEQWYKLATTNAASIAFIEGFVQGRWGYLGSGFVMRGRQLHPDWDDTEVIVTGNHVVNRSSGVESARNLRVRFPAVSAAHPTEVKAFVWMSDDRTPNTQHQLDVAVLRLAGPAPTGVRAVEGISDLDTSDWPQVKLIGGVTGAVEKSVLPTALPLVVLGGSLDGVHARRKIVPFGALKPSLTLSLANALGRSSAETAIILTDSTTAGSSGSAVFDARDGRLVGLIQFGSDPGLRPKTGLAFSGGTTLRQLTRAIDAQSRERPLDWARWLLSDGKLQRAQSVLEAALASHTTKPHNVAGVYIEYARDALGDGRLDEANSVIRLALSIDPAINQKAAQLYRNRGLDLLRDGKGSEADAVFKQALQTDPAFARTIAGTIVQHGQSLLWQENLIGAKLAFDKAVATHPAVTEEIADALIERGASLLQRSSYVQGKLVHAGGDVAAAREMFEIALSRHPGSAKKVASTYVRRGAELLRYDSEAEAEATFAVALTFNKDALEEIQSARSIHDAQLGGRLLREGKEEEAERLFARALAHTGRDAPMLAVIEEIRSHRIDRVVALLEASEEKSAATFTSRHLGNFESPKLRQAWTSYYVQQGLELLEAGKEEAARKQFEKAIANGEDAETTVGNALVQHGSLFLTKRQPEQARRMFQWATAYGKNIAEQVAYAHFSYANELLAAGLDADAKEHFESAVRYDSARRQDVARAYADHGARLLVADKDEAATANFKRAVAHDAGVSPTVDQAWARLHVRRGRHLLREGNEEAARRLFAKARALHKSEAAFDRREWGTIFGEIAVAWHQASKPAEALADAEMAVELGATQHRLLLGEMLFAIGRVEDAFFAFDDVVEDLVSGNDDNKVAAQFNRGRCFEALGEKDEAILDFRTAMRNGTSFGRASDASIVTAARERLAALGATESGEVREGPQSNR